MKQKIYENLCEICEKKLKNANQNDVKKFESIKKILSHENCFEKIDFQVSMNILLDLGIDKNQAVEIYKKLVA